MKQEAPEIEVSSAPAKEEGFVRVSITDNGPGLKPEEIENYEIPYKPQRQTLRPGTFDRSGNC